MNLMSDALVNVHKCKKGKLLLREDYKERYGLNSSLYVECSNCKKREFLLTSKNITDKGKSYDINWIAVFASLELGIGFNGLETFCAHLDLKCLGDKSYYKQLDTILNIIEKDTLEEMKSAGLRLRKVLQKDDQNVTDETLLHIAVSFDGTSAKRGHTSLFGIMFVISVDTREVLDYHVLSKFSKSCSVWEAKKDDDPFKYTEWKISHTSDCTMNFEGRSPAMEAEGALIYWSRSLERHNLRYKLMESDGDSKAFTKVKESEVYGPDCEIEKLDCIGHVQKRMRKRLMNLKATHKEKLADGKTIGGRGRLSDFVIKKIQRYYGFAIWQNVRKGENATEKQKEISMYQMRKNIWNTSSHDKDLAQQYLYCPRGSESWCAWQRDVADGTKTYKNINCLPNVFFDLLKPILLDLSEEKLLARCVQGATQNPNESINSLSGPDV